MNVCKIDACDKPVIGRGLCSAHYNRWRRHGDPEGGGITPGTLHDWLATYATLDTCHPDLCLLWPFRSTHKGYGKIRHGGLSYPAHRVACETAHGPAPADRPFAAHDCGVRLCCNPHHLRWATAQENTDDMLRHGTRQFGTLHPRSKLTDADVLAIRANPDGLTQHQLAERYGINRANVSMIITRKTWKHLLHVNMKTE